ncbi:MAG: hypothetical protein ACI9CE_000930 [Flavobacterium sp.]|jgi:hypothetical protein
MALLGSFAYITSSELLREISLRQLDALAESKARDLLKVNEGWKNQVRLIHEGSGLSTLMRSNNEDKDRAKQHLRLIGERSIEAVEALVQIKIVEYGQVSSNFGIDYRFSDIILPSTLDEIQYSGSFHDEAGVLYVVYTALLPGENPGHIEVVFNTVDVDSVTGNYTGLGETGEVMLVQLEKDETVTVLNSSRFQEQSENEVARFPLEDASDAVQRVVSGQSGIFDGGHKDYRGKTVWAATRFLSDLGWGLVVKIDSTEEGKRADFLFDALIDIAIALSAFAIIGGTLLGFYLARPIHELAVFVGRIRDGEEGLRADVKGDDEIAYLAGSINAMLEYFDSLKESDSEQKPAKQPPPKASGDDSL